MRKIWDIHGGIHPLENKHQSLQSPIAKLPLPSIVVLPLSQHIGAPAEAIVQVGDKVLKGQMIAKATGPMSVPVHASTSGEVVAIGHHEIPHPSGMTGPCISIKPDGEDRWIERQGVADFSQLDKNALLDIVRDAGLCGMGGAGFPTAIKLNPPPNKPIDTLIINGTECEPYITADDILMRERAPGIIEGVKILAHLIKPQQVLIGIEDNKPEAIEAMRKAASGSGFEIVVFPTKYPSGGEKQLIQILTGKEVPSGGLPADIGIVCQNIGTTYALYRAVVLGEPLVERITTVTGQGVSKPQNFEVPLGTPVNELLAAAGFKGDKLSRLVMGGPMMGFSLRSNQVPVVKTTNCVLAPTLNEIPPPAPQQACIRCGMCAEACPVSLLPQQMYWFARSQEYDKLESQNLFDCIECGACSFSCPSNIPLVQYYRNAKSEIRTRAQEKAKADASKLRFEAKQARLQREEEEKEAARKARQAAKQAKASSGAGAEDPVAAALARAQARKAEASSTPAAPVDPRTALVQALETAEKRAQTTRDKLDAVRGTDKEAAFLASLEKLDSKVSEARQALADFDASQPATAPTAAEAPAADLDPVQAAIERAKAKRAAQTASGADDADPRAKLVAALEQAEKRFNTAKTKVDEAQAQGADTLAALQAGLAKVQLKVDEARQALVDFDAKPAQEAPAEPAPVLDAAQAAIERAKAKRAQAASGESSGDTLEQLQKALEQAQQRLANARDKAEKAEQSGESADVTSALRSAVGKMEAKLREAQAALDDHQNKNG